MSKLSEAKILGGIGAIFSLVGGIVPYIGPIVSITGLVLVFIAVKSISQITKDDDIFRNYLMHFILSIISIIAIFLIMLIAFGAVGGFSWITSLESADITNFTTFWEYFGSLIGACILALFVGWILSVLAAMYLKKCYNAIAEYTKVDLFRTTGTVYFIGAITTIVLIGFLILFIAKIIEIIAYFTLPDNLTTGDNNEPSGRRCPNCGRIIPEDARICPYCSKKFEE
jgi:uncharacterized membrane protein